MAGRAGRPLDAKGEAILLAEERSHDMRRVLALMSDEIAPADSQLLGGGAAARGPGPAARNRGGGSGGADGAGADAPDFASGEGEGIARFVLEIVVSGLAASSEDVEAAAEATLLGAQRGAAAARGAARDALRFLVAAGFFRLARAPPRPERILPRPLAEAAIVSTLSPASAVLIHDELLRVQEGLILADDLHILFAIAPAPPSSLFEVDWPTFDALWRKAGGCDRGSEGVTSGGGGDAGGGASGAGGRASVVARISALVGIEEPFVNALVHDPSGFALNKPMRRAHSAQLEWA
jgi:hypothetical protein